MSGEFSLDDLEKIAEKMHRMGGLSQPYEAAYAIQSGWDRGEFEELYKEYIASTQVDPRTTGNKTTQAKGNPLERVARYFLEKGGIAKNVRPGGIPNRWTVDGMGETHPDRLERILGKKASSLCGPQLYMEAKNQQSAMGPEDWAQHCSRMKGHGCTFGIVFSTGGYGFRAGQGYATELFFEYLREIVHILFSVADLKRVCTKGEFPWAVLKTAYLRQLNQGYEVVDVQRDYSTSNCLGLAASEHERLTSMLPIKTSMLPIKHEASTSTESNSSGYDSSPTELEAFSALDPQATAILSVEPKSTEKLDSLPAREDDSRPAEPKSEVVPLPASAKPEAPPSPEPKATAVPSVEPKPL